MDLVSASKRPASWFVLVGSGVVAGVVVESGLTVLALDQIGTYVPVLIAFIQIATAGVSIVALATRRSRATMIVAGTWAALSIGGCAIPMPAGAWMDSRAEGRGDSIVQGLERYRARTHVYPPSLAALVPTDLPSVPETGMRLLVDDRFDYGVGIDGNDYGLSFSGSGPALCSRTATREWYCSYD